MRRRWVPLVMAWPMALPAEAQWSPDPAANNPVAVVDDTQFAPVAAADGFGGVVVAWKDHRSGNPAAPTVYAQRMGAAGLPLWPLNGVQVSTTEGAAPLNPSLAIVSAGAGGAIIAWRARQSDAGDIMAQRLDSAGVPVWGPGGIPIAVLGGLQVRPVAVADGSGGAIVAWQDGRSGIDDDIYVQRVDSGGAVQWQANGVPLCLAPGDQLLPSIVPDGMGGAIVAWSDARADASDVYARRVDAMGTPQWAPDGVPVAVATGAQLRQVGVSDGAGGVILAWEDERNGADADVYAQRLGPGGAPLWTANGVQVADTPLAGTPAIVGDDAGGAIVAWQDLRGSSVQVFAQRLAGALGTPLWPVNGVAVATSAAAQQFVKAARDGAGGAVLAWEDARGADIDVYAQRLDAGGIRQWLDSGVAISIATGDQKAIALARDAGSGAILAWEDGRVASPDIYASHVDGTGTLPVDLTGFGVE